MPAKKQKSKINRVKKPLQRKAVLPTLDLDEIHKMPTFIKERDSLKPSYSSSLIFYLGVFLGVVVVNVFIVTVLAIMSMF